MIWSYLKLQGLILQAFGPPALGLEPLVVPVRAPALIFKPFGFDLEPFGLPGLDLEPFGPPELDLEPFGPSRA